MISIKLRIMSAASPAVQGTKNQLNAFWVKQKHFKLLQGNKQA
ncbi:hypothetical protein AALB_2875 [Agarivorans albus MKT 106]|uniref:Uncharacterized protein n=1 Tax=Agarivorans albus MKT 106 TaxID=1331007 RepID=R9PNB7_AGAAL|nr:hypothetical protein AALB_2875 [Agarivorans albus MKT 106]